MVAILFLPSAVRGESPRERGDLAIRARAILKTHCSECHRPGGQSFDMLDHAALVGPHPIPFLNVKKSGRSQIIEFLKDGSMPPGGKPRPSAADIEALEAWIAAGAPAYPKNLDDATVATIVELDWRSRKPAENERYISFANRVEAGAIGLKDDESKLRAALQAATTEKRTVQLEPVDPAGIVYRLDAKKLGWLEPDFFHEIGLNRQPGSVVEFVAWDLLQIEYPFPAVDPARFQKLAPRRPFAPSQPVLRGDWLLEALAAGSPLAADLRAMAELADSKDGMALGPKLTTATWVTPSAKDVPPPLLAWYSGGRPGPFEVQFAVKDRTPPFTAKAGDKLPLIATADRTARAMLFSILPDSTVQPLTRMETILKRGEPFGFNPVSLTPPGAVTEWRERFVLLAAENDLPKFTLIRSSHQEDITVKDRAPIWRIVVNREGNPDLARITSQKLEVKVLK